MLYCVLYLDAKKPHLVEVRSPGPLGSPLKPALVERDQHPFSDATRFFSFFFPIDKNSRRVTTRYVSAVFRFSFVPPLAFRKHSSISYHLTRSQVDDKKRLPRRLDHSPPRTDILMFKI
jgi:hypothetical protein